MKQGRRSPFGSWRARPTLLAVAAATLSACAALESWSQFDSTAAQGGLPDASYGSAGSDASFPDIGNPVEASVPTGGHDAAVTGDAASGSGGALTYLSLDDAARVCALLFQCDTPSGPATPANPGGEPNLLLTQSLLASLAFPADPWNFASCMNWLAGPLPPDRLGVQAQRSILACMAGKTTCTDAFSCLPVEVMSPNDARCPSSNVELCTADNLSLQCDNLRTDLRGAPAGSAISGA